MGGLCSKQISQGAQRILAEGVGTFILCFAILLSSEVLDGSNAPTFYAAGFTLASLAYGLEHIGGHFNPAVSLGAFLQGELSVLMLLAVILSQTVGGTLGGVLGNVLRASPIPSYNPPNLGKAFFVEAIFSGGLVLVSQSVGLFKNTQQPNSFFGVSLGFFLSAGVSSVSVISGGAFNPVVGMAVDFSTLPKDPRTFDDIWLYWLAPFAGSVVASIFSRAVSNSLRAQANNPLPLPLFTP
jgi:aquaporin Z